MFSCRKCKNRVIGYMFIICPWIWLKNFTRRSSSKVKVLAGKISQGKLPEENAKITRLLFVDRSRGEASSKSNLSNAVFESKEAKHEPRLRSLFVDQGESNYQICASGPKSLRWRVKVRGKKFYRICARDSTSLRSKDNVFRKRVSQRKCQNSGRV